MASLQERKRKNGKIAYVIQFSLGGVRRSVFLNAKYTKRVAKETSLYVDELAAAREFDAPLDRRVLAWLENIDDGLRERLGRAGLIATNKNVSIGELVELYMEAESPSMKPNTIDGKRVRFRQSAQRLDFAQRASRLEVADVVRFKTKLDADFSEATRAGILKAMSRVYSWGESLGYVSNNPFSQVPKGSFSNKKKETFVTMETYRRLIDGCDDAELRVLLSFYRIGGLRLGEAFEARWEDVDWRAERFTVRSPKTERSGKDRRLIPLFPELRRELEALRSESRADDFIVVRRRDKQSVYNAIKNLCVALGIPVWARLVQNLRASRSNEIYREFNEVAESEWIGHTATTARRHYLHLLDDDFAKALSKS
jgi:integrase